MDWDKQFILGVSSHSVTVQEVQLLCSLSRHNSLEMTSVRSKGNQIGRYHREERIFGILEFYCCEKKKYCDSKPAMLPLESEMVPEPASHTLQPKHTSKHRCKAKMSSPNCQGPICHFFKAKKKVSVNISVVKGSIVFNLF